MMEKFQSETFLKLGEIVKSDAIYEQRTGNDDVYAEFLERFPPSKLESLTLDQYCMGKDSKEGNFCWWLERGLDKTLCKYSPGSARGHLLYYDRDGSVYQNKKFAHLPPEEALLYTLKVHSAIANANMNEDVSWVDDRNEIFKKANVEPLATMGNARKLMLLNAYHPDHFVPINSVEHIRQYLSALGHPKDEIPSKKSRSPVATSRILFEYYLRAKTEFNPKLTPYGFAKALYSEELGIKAKSEHTIKKIVDSEDAESVQSNSLNTILYGPPGTGKTYNTVNKAVELIDPDFYADNESDREAIKNRFDALRDNERIGFVTFHQSFSYEDFVEGLKAQTNDDGVVRYDVEEGIFKRMCALASSTVEKSQAKQIDLNGKRFWKMSLGNTQSAADTSIYDECIENDYVLLGYGGSINFAGANSRDDIEEVFTSAGKEIKESNDYGSTAVNVFKNKIAVGDLIVISDGNKKFRAIGEVTGDYYLLDADDRNNFLQCRKVEWLKAYDISRPVEELFKKSLSQMTLYQLKPQTLKLDALSALLNNVSTASIKDKRSSFIVGEIFGSDNRVLRTTDDLLEIRKPNGSKLHFSNEMLSSLASYVRSGQITLEDIRNKSWAEKIDSDIEKHIVNGYVNLVTLLVERLLQDEVERPTVQVDHSPPYVLIIDEINRGNIAKIFGELITLIEPSKRAGAAESLSVRLPYSKDEFAVPSNLYLIGTMNTADRSLAQIDIALRRRFNFEELMPDLDVLKDIPSVSGIDVSKMLEAINMRIELLYDREHTIGHSHFLSLLDDPTLDCLAEIFEYQILPLLEEYFFEDWDLIAQVLGDNFKPSESKFIKPKYRSQKIVQLMGEDWADQNQQQVYVRNPDALTSADAYIGIYQSIEDDSVL